MKITFVADKTYQLAGLIDSIDEVSRAINVLTYDQDASFRIKWKSTDQKPLKEKLTGTLTLVDDVNGSFNLELKNVTTGEAGCYEYPTKTPFQDFLAKR